MEESKKMAKIACAALADKKGEGVGILQDLQPALPGLPRT